MTPIRIRLQCEAPSIKAWFLLADLNTIGELKVALCTNVTALKNTGVLPANLSLALDGFDLLSESDVSILREGDLVCLQITQEESQTGQNRSAPKIENPVLATASTSHTAPAAKPLVQSSSIESSDEDSSTSADASSSSSEATSSSESDDSSDEDSSGSEAPSTAPVRRAVVPNGAPRTTTSAAPSHSASTEHIPPGFGKPQTIKRNERRRRKRMHDRERLDTLNDVSGPQPAGLSSTNSVPLGARATTKQPTPVSLTTNLHIPLTTPAPSYPMSSLSNKNKRRGYKDAPLVLPSKIVFDNKAVHPATSPLPPLADVSSTHLPRLIPPSELQAEGAIPSAWNLFVTSVDVEEGMSRRHKKRKHATSNTAVSYAEKTSAVDDLDDSEVVEQLEQAMSDQDMLSISAVEPSSTKSVAWKDVDKRFDQFPLLMNLAGVSAGVRFAWKALDINPVTFTPEILLHVAECCNLSGDTVTVRHIQPPGARPLAFGQHDDDDDGVEDDLMDVTEDTISLEEAQLGGWRVVS